jgi:uncharacterized protein YbjT (DUF2867 family)
MRVAIGEFRNYRKQEDTMILVTGASGNVGGAVLRELLQAGAPVRGMYRSPEEAAKAPAAANPVVADFADRASLNRALNGVKKVFLVCAPIPQLVELESNMVDACREHGIHHVVQNSALGASVYSKSFPSWHYAVEQRLHASGVPATILRPESFMQNIAMFYAGTIKSDRAFYAAGGDAPIAFVDMRDVAAVAAKVLTSDGYAGKTYTLTGPEAFTYAQVAEKLSKLLGTTIKYVNLSPQQLKQSVLQLGMPQWQADALVDLAAYYTEGPGAKITQDVQQVLGRQPMRFDQFLRDYAASFAAKSAVA